MTQNFWQEAMCERQTSEYLNDDNADGNANQYSNVTIEPRLKGSLTSLHSQYSLQQLHYNNNNNNRFV